MREYQISEEYRTGIEQIEQQHAKLLDHTQRAYELFADENMLFKSEDIRNILEGLDYYSEVHFAYEEAYMEEIGFEGMEAHKRQHEAFRKKIQEFISRVPLLSLATQDAMCGEVFEYLQEWWKVHIICEDMKYAEYSRECETAASF